MKETDFRIERILHAYVDGELDSRAKSRLLVQLENNERISTRVCELQRAKEWVKCSFEGETARTRTLPGIQWRLRNTPPRYIAASILIVLISFGAGWTSHLLKENVASVLALNAANREAPKVILHISSADEAHFVRVLKRAEQILRQYRNTDAQIEVVANAGGLDLVRTASSQHIDSIKHMIAHYDNVRFIACALGLDKLRKRGFDATVIDGVDAHEPAADHLVERLTEGWTYIRI